MNSIKYTIKNWLQRLDLFYQIRYSTWYLNRLRRKNGHLRAILEKESQMYAKALAKLPNPPQLIFDIGANEGYTIDAFLKTNSQIIAVEPGKRMLSALHVKFVKNELVTIVPKAVSNCEGTAQFHAHEDAALNTLNVKWHEKTTDISTPESPKYLVNTTTLDILIKKYGNPDFIKIDVEGHEMEVLEGLSQTVSMISFEANLPDFREETLACLDKLATLNPTGVFNFTHDFEWIFENSLNFEQARNFIKKTNKEYLEVFFISK
jgi:FkbM family methyltransferase